MDRIWGVGDGVEMVYLFTNVKCQDTTPYTDEEKIIDQAEANKIKKKLA